MESGGFADVTTIRFEGLLWPVSVSKAVKDRLGSASAGLSNLTSLELSNFVINAYEEFSPSLRAQLQDLRVDCFSAPAASFESRIQGFPNLHTLRLCTREGMVAIEVLAQAFETGGLKNLCALILFVGMYFGPARTYLPLLLAPIKRGRAPNLKGLSLNVVMPDEDLDVHLEFFPFLSTLFLLTSQSGKARLQQAAEEHAGLTLTIL